MIVGAIRLVFLLLASSWVGSCAQGADRAEELPLEAALGNREAFANWRTGLESRFRERLATIGGVTPTAARVVRIETVSGIELRVTAFDYPESSPLRGRPGGGVLALPTRADAAKPLLIAIHGYEHPEWGQLPLGLFTGKKLPWALVKAGSEQPLDFLRREYHLRDHPRCWSISGFQSYLPIQALTAPRAVQFQRGGEDSWFPSGEPFPKQGDWFPGTPRDVLSDQIAGARLIRESVWRLQGGKVSHHIHGDGHELDVAAALRFLDVPTASPWLRGLSSS